jgi:cell division protein FtsZ
MSSKNSNTPIDPLGIAGGKNPVNNPNEHTNPENSIHTNTQETMKFDLPEQSSIIKVIGVGGGGSNAVNHMYRAGINGVDFVVCNTDKQALDMSPVPHKVVLGATLTEGRGAGSLPEVGRNAAIENIEDIRAILAKNTKMVFITAGMGGGTGTGAAPIIAGIAREMGILTVAIVTIPFLFEGKKRRAQAEEGMEQLKQNVDTLLVICNDKLREMYGNLKLSDAFSHADDVLTIAAKSIAEVISLTQQINVDFADVCTVMKNSGVAIMGSAMASGENRAIRAVETALNSPLLNDNNITGARYVLLNIVSGSNEITMDELGEITDYIQDAAGQTAEIIKGYGVEPSYGDSVNVTIIATGFNQHSEIAYEYSRKPAEQKIVRTLEEPKNETSEPVAETKIETLNPLEPFLINKQPAPESKQEEIKSEAVAEITNPLEPFLKSEPVAEVKEAAAETTISSSSEPVLLEVKEEIVSESTEEIFISETSVESTMENVPEIVAELTTEPVAETVIQPVAEVAIEPVAETKEETSSFEEVNWNDISTSLDVTSSVAESNVQTFESSSESTIESSSEVIEQKEVIEPVANTNVEFEITNFSSESSESVVAETTSEVESTWETTSSESNWNSETVSENISEPVMEQTSEIVSETTVSEITSVSSEVNEPVAEITEEKTPEAVNEPVLIRKEVVAEVTVSPEDSAAAEEEARRLKIVEQEKKAQERIQRLKELSMKLKTPQALNEMEKEPAYKRRNIQLENTPHSSESQISRFTLTENEEKKIEIRPNNSFLHDNVD